MNARRCPWPVVVAALGLVVSSRAFGQSEEGKRTPRPDDVRPQISDPEDGLTRRLGKDRELNDTEKAVQRILAGLSAKDKEALVQQIQKNPTFQRQLTEELRNNKELRDKLIGSVRDQGLTDEQKRLVGEAAGIVQKPPVKTPPHTGTNPEEITPLGAKPGTAAPSTSAETKPKTEEPSGLKKIMKEALPKAADLLAKLGLAEDADFIRALLRGKVLDDNDGYLAQAVRKGIAVAKELPLEKLLSGDFSSVVGNFHLPELPQFNLPFGGDSSPSSSSSSGVSAEGTGIALFWILVLIVLAVFLWKGRELFTLSTATTVAA